MDYSDIGKSKYKSDLGSGNSGGNFEYGSGIKVTINPVDDCCDYDNTSCGGATEAQEAFTNWDKKGGGSEATYTEYEVGPANG